jgi:hypothetical protein
VSNCLCVLGLVISVKRGVHRLMFDIGWHRASNLWIAMAPHDLRVCG